MKTKFMAGLVASLICLLFVTGIAVLGVLIFDLDAENKAFTYPVAFGTIAIWLGIYNKLKPKPPVES